MLKSNKKKKKCIPDAPAAQSTISGTDPGTCSGTGTAYRPTALPTVAPYALPVPGFVPEAPAAAAHARPVHLIITMIKWIRTIRLSMKNSLSAYRRRPPPPPTPRNRVSRTVCGVRG